MNVEVITGNPFNSTTNILIPDPRIGSAWIVDCGNAEKVIETLRDSKLLLRGVFLTHAHFDHIYGLNELVECFPETKVYTSLIGLEMLQDARKNMSYYWGQPIVFKKPENVIGVQNSWNIPLIGNYSAKAVFTPGHNPSCITWVIDDCIFTGDSYIPGIKTVTNLPGGNKLQAAESEKLILSLAQKRTVFPGHAV